LLPAPRAGLLSVSKTATRPAKSNFELGVRPHFLNAFRNKEEASGYRLGQVNSRGESWLSERDFRPAPASGGEQLAAENGGIPGLQRADGRAERLSAWAVLAEGEELSSNPLLFFFNSL
jgi:hypothetical protein